jgi:uncharacterized protein (DUF2267 family)
MGNKCRTPADDVLIAVNVPLLHHCDEEAVFSALRKGTQMATKGKSTLNEAPQLFADWFDGLCEDFGWEETQAYPLLRERMDAVRDTLEIQDSEDLAEQLLLLVRGVTGDGRTPAGIPPISGGKRDCLHRVQAQAMKEPDEDQDRALAAVFGLLRCRGTNRATYQVKHTMLQPIQKFRRRPQVDIAHTSVLR